MKLLLLFAAASLWRDEVKDLVDKIRAAKDLSQRYQLEYQLGRAAKPAHVAVLLKEIDAGPEEIRPHFVRAIRSIGGRESTAALKVLLQPKYDWGTRGTAAVQLKFAGDESGMKMMVAEFPKMKREDRQKVLEYLYPWYWEGKEITAALRKVLETETDESLRSRLIDLLVAHRDSDALPLFRKIAANSGDTLRFEARAALVKLGDSTALEELLSDLEGGRIPINSLFRVMDAFRVVGTATVADRLRAAVESLTDSSTRVQVVRTLAQMRDRKSLPLFHKLASESDAIVAQAALDAILELAGRSEIDNLRKILSHSNTEIRLRAAEVLIALDDLSGLDAVREELSNSTVSWRRRAVNVLLTCRRREAVELLLLAMADADLQVRTTASTALVSTLSALFPYVKFDLKKAGYDPTSEDRVLREKSIERIRAWWNENAPK